MKNRNTVFNALPIVAAHYGDKFGVKVVVGGSDARTNGDVILLPNIAENYPQKKVIWGYLAHESGHVRMSDFELLPEVIKSGIPFRKSILNAIEDYRIERGMIELYPGVTHDLNQMVVYLKDCGLFQAANKDSHPSQILQSKILYWLRSKLLNQPVDDLEQSAEMAMSEVFNEGVNTRLAVLLRKASTLETTRDCLNLTDSILKMLEEEEENEREQNQNDVENSSGDDVDPSNDSPQDQSSSDSTDPSNDDSERENSSADSDDNSDGASSKGDDSDQDDIDGQQSGQSNSQPGDSSQDDDSDQSEAESNSSDGTLPPDTSKGDGIGSDQAIRQALEASDDDLPQDAIEALKEEFLNEADLHGDGDYCTIPTAPDLPGNESAGASMLQQVGSTTSKLRAQLMGLVQSSKQNRDRSGYTGRRLNSSQLHRVLKGDTKIFRKRDHRIQPNTAVHILTDLSGSMDGYEEVVARESSMAIAMALESIPGVNPAVTYFGGYSDDPVRAVVRHGQSVYQQAKKFPHGTWGCTPLAEAIWYAAFELSKTLEERHLLMVVTDGQPDDSLATEKVLKLCENAGIETIGIGIGHEVEDYFDRSVVIHSVDELRQTLFRLMRDKLIVQAA